MGTHKLYGQVPEGDVTGLVADLVGKQGTAEKGVANGYGSLDASGRQPIGEICIHGHAATDILSGTINIARIPVGTATSTVAAGDDTRLSVKPFPPVNLTDGATPALNAALGTHFRLTAAGNRTIAIPTNPTDGQVIVIEHTASAAIRTLALNTGTGGFAYGADITGLTATASGLTDYIQAVYRTSVNKWRVIGYAKGY